MGETELVLDGLTVDETLRILGAGAGIARGAERRESSSAAPRVEREAGPLAAPMERELPAGGEMPGDWRNALRAAGAAPGEFVAAKPAKPPAPEPAHADAESGLTVGTPGGELFGGPIALLDSIEKIAAHVASCTRCPLYSTATNPVPG